MPGSVVVVEDRWRAAVLEVVSPVVDSDVFIWRAASTEKESGTTCLRREMNEKAHRAMFLPHRHKLLQVDSVNTACII